MKRFTPTAVNDPRKNTACKFAVCAFAFCVLAGDAVAQQAVPPEKVSGRQVCTTCHISEQAAWDKSSHSTKAWSLLSHPKAEGFAKALGVSDIKGSSTCTQCHGTQQVKQGKLTIAHGNSCESCHGGSGGADGWLKKHFDFGTGRKLARGITIAQLLEDRAKETPAHRAARDKACKAAGMNRSADAFDIASNCLQCHLVPNEKLVDAGHPMSSRFEFVEWSQGEVRHNFLFDAKQNAEVPTGWSDRQPTGTAESRKRLMYVAGQLADLFVNLQIRASVTSVKRKSLGDEANDRILDIHEELTDANIPDLARLLTAIGKFDKKTLKTITPDDKQKYGRVAMGVKLFAKKFVADHQDGSKLPAGIKIPNKAKGDPYQP
jgi:hypothetical protein